VESLDVWFVAGVEHDSINLDSHIGMFFRNIVLLADVRKSWANAETSIP